MAEQQTHAVNLVLTGDRYEILLDALHAYVNEALEEAQAEGVTAAERERFQSVAMAAAQLLDDIG